PDDASGAGALGDPARLGHPAADRRDPPDPGGEAPEREAAPAVEVRATIGDPVEQPYPVHVERFNGVLRDRLGCRTRKTHAFAKEIARWDALFHLTLFAHNWLRPHVALRVRLPAAGDGRRCDQRTPAMAVGLPEHISA